MNEEKYAKHIRNKIVNYFNLPNDELDVNYVKAIINASSYNLFDSVFSLVLAFHENTKFKRSEKVLEQFTNQLVQDKKKFDSQIVPKQNLTEIEKNKKEDKWTEKDRGEHENGNIYYANNKNEKKKIKEKNYQKNIQKCHTEENNNVFMKNLIFTQKKKACQNSSELDSEKPEKEVKKEKTENLKLTQKIEKQNEKELTKHTKDIQDELKEKVGFNKKVEEVNAKNEMDKAEIPIDATEVNNAIDVTVDAVTEEALTIKKEDFDYFSQYVDLENTSSLKFVIGLIEESESTKKKVLEKKKYIEICVCNGKNHKLYANCLICGKVYCTKMKYSNCIYCESKLYEFSIFDKIFLENNINDKHVLKNIKEARSSCPALYNMYFNSQNEELKNAFNIRQKMLNNSLDDNQTRVIDDSTDWFEADILDEVKQQAGHFRFYDDEVKNEIIEKYYQIFDKKYTDINVNIDLANLKFEENEDYFKIKELKEYLKQVEKNYNLNLKRERNKGQLQNPRKYLEEKEKKNFNYLTDLRAVLFKEQCEKSEKQSTENIIRDMNHNKVIKNKKYNVLNQTIDEEAEEEEEEKQSEEIEVEGIRRNGGINI